MIPMIPVDADYFPDEIIFMILTRLPVKLLLRFRCVCKTWDSIIRSQAFILNYTFSTSQSYFYLHFLGLPNSSLIPKSHAMLCDSSFSVISKLDIHSTFSTFSYSPFVIGLCNGLFCLTEIFRFGHEVYLWNPSIRKYKILQLSSMFSGKSNQKFREDRIWTIVGLGFDSKTNDYKVLRLAFFRSTRNKRRKLGAEIYSLSFDSWRSVGLPAHLMKNLTEILSWDYAYVDGAMHWLAEFVNEGEPYSSILRFDVSEERFNEVEIPDYRNGIICRNQQPIVFKGVLALLVGGYEPTDQSFGWVCYLWTMNNSIWTKQKVDFESIGIRCECIGDHLIVDKLDDEKFYLFDPQTLEAKAMEIPHFTSIHGFTEGLTLL